MIRLPRFNFSVLLQFYRVQPLIDPFDLHFVAMNRKSPILPLGCFLFLNRLVVWFIYLWLCGLSKYILVAPDPSEAESSLVYQKEPGLGAGPFMILSKTPGQPITFNINQIKAKEYQKVVLLSLTIDNP